VLYIGALAAPNTVNTMPEETLLAFDAHGQVERTLPRDGGDGDATLAAYGRAGIDVIALANQLQMQGAKSFDESSIAFGQQRDLSSQTSQ
jgi:transaldolase